MTGSHRSGCLRALLVALTLAPAPVSTASAAGPSVEAALTPDRITAGGKAATLTIVVRSGGLSLPEPPLPHVAGLTFDPAGTSQSFSVIQGRVERSLTVAYRVGASRPGVYVIPPLRVGEGSARAETKPLTLTVLPPGPAAPRGPAARESWSGRGGPPEVFARLLVDRERVYWNQELVAQLRIYARVPLEGAPDWTAPETPGFWIEDLGAPTAGSARVGNYVYVVNEIRWALFPTNTGRLTIGPARVRCRVNRLIPAPDPWSSLGFPEVEPQDVTLETDPVRIAVEPIPPGAPSGFSGAVGSYSMAVRIDRGAVPAGEPAIVTTLVRGEGNIASLGDPEVSGPLSARRSVIGASTRIDRSGTTLKGERTRQVAFFSDAPGRIQIDPVRFAWFDPSEGRFRSVTSDTIRIRVLPGTGAGEARAAAARSLGPVAPPRTGSGPGGTLALGPPTGALAVSSIALAGYAAAVLLVVLRRRRARDPRALRRAALDQALRALAATRAGRVPGGAESPTAQAGEALLAGLAARYEVPGAGRSRANVLVEAGLHGATAGERSESARILAAFDAIAFAPPETRSADVAREIRAAEDLLARWRKELSS